MNKLNILKGTNVIIWGAVFAMMGLIILLAVPWYAQENPMRIIANTKSFWPGESMQLMFKRRALIGFRGAVTRELVRVDPVTGVTEEIWKNSLNTSVGRGTKTISLQYRIPTMAMYPEMEPDTYKWQGAMVYRPFGLAEKTFFFETEEFQIKTTR